MSMKDLQEGYNLIDKYFTEDDMKFYGKGASKELIDKAEKALGLSFPPTYRNFLEKFGYSYDCYGITSDNFINSSVPNAIWLALTDRKEFNYPHHLIPICETGLGGYYSIDCSSKNVDGDCKVLFIPVGANDQEPFYTEVEAEDFGAFFLKRVKDEIKEHH